MSKHLKAFYNWNLSIFAVNKTYKYHLPLKIIKVISNFQNNYEFKQWYGTHIF